MTKEHVTVPSWEQVRGQWRWVLGWGAEPGGGKPGEVPRSGRCGKDLRLRSSARWRTLGRGKCSSHSWGSRPLGRAGGSESYPSRRTGQGTWEKAISGQGTHPGAGWGAGRGLGSRAKSHTQAPQLDRSRSCRAGHQAPTGHPQQTPLHQARRLQRCEVGNGCHHDNPGTSIHPCPSQTTQDQLRHPHSSL